MASYIPTYRVEILVTPEGSQYYPPVGTIETLSNDNAGYDVKIIKDQEEASVAALVPLGIKARMIQRTIDSKGEVLEVGCHYTLEPRSSIFKTGFIMANTRGIIDKSYRGELKAPLITVGKNVAKLEAGTRLFQILAPNLGHIETVVYVDSLDSTLRGEGGFGSTGLK
jgi:deoxyuridine 5'-triphosphate nucleotidohydrolase